VLNGLKKQPNSILFIDEIHTIVGAGATSGGSMDASIFSSPHWRPVSSSASARRPIMITKATLSATAHWRAVFKKSKFPNRAKKTRSNSRRLEAAYEKHHGVRYSSGAIRAAVKLSAKHINDRRLPDKAIDVIDEIGAAVKIQPEEKRRKTIGPKDVENYGR